MQFNSLWISPSSVTGVLLKVVQAIPMKRFAKRSRDGNQNIRAFHNMTAVLSIDHKRLKSLNSLSEFGVILLCQEKDHNLFSFDNDTIIMGLTGTYKC